MDGFGNEGMYRWGTPQLEQLIEAGRDASDIMKALTTGSGIVPAGATSGEALRTQFLLKLLEKVSFSQEDAKVMKIIPKKKADSVAVEWTNYVSYGGVGDGFTGESGSDGNGNVNSADDNFLRQIQNVRYLATQRTVTMAAGLVKNIENPMVAAETGATLFLISKAELANFWGDTTLHVLQYNGMMAQIMQALDSFPEKAPVLYDAGGGPVDQAMIEDIAVTNRQLWGEGTLLLNSIVTHGDIQKALFPLTRVLLGSSEGGMGQDRDFAKVPYGRIKLEWCPMLRANQPMTMDGPGVTGLPRVAATADPNALAFATQPFATASAGSAGTGNFWRNFNRNTDSAAVPAPALPSGGNNANRLAAADYLYAVAPVYQGLEGVAWVYGAATAGTATGASSIDPSAGQIVQIAISTASITGLGSTYPLNSTKFRVYRAPSTATQMNQFLFLGETGCPTAGNPTLYDNGFTIPGLDTSFLVTQQKNGIDGWGFWQLLPIMKRELPHTTMFNMFALLLFATLVLRVPSHHMIIRNIGRWVAS